MLTNLRLAQLYGVLRLEIKKTFFSRRGLWIYLLALGPAALFAAHSAIEILHHQACDFGLDTNILANVFQFFYLRLAVFFGCLGIFMNLFRGELLDKSLHFYFLAPIRRDVLLAGKFLAGLLAATVIFCTGMLLQFPAMYAHFPAETVRRYFVEGGGWHHLISYLAVTALACAGYGSVFLAAGILLRNPIIPAAVILVWEAANVYLPAWLQKFSIIYYLKSLCPISVSPDVPPPFNLLAANADPAPAAVAGLGLLAVIAVVLTFATFRVRKMEINYGTD